jgi:hypothetical protein
MRCLRPALGLTVAAIACVGPTRVSLLPPIDPSAARRGPAQTLVARVPPPDRDALGPRQEGPVLPPSVQVSIAALALLLITGTLPLVGVFGNFEETGPFVSPARRRPTRPAARDWRDDPDCPAFLCGRAPTVEP